MSLNNKFHEDSSNLFEQYNKNLNWINMNYESLLLYYKNKYVAVREETLIDSDFVYSNLLKRIKCNYKSSWKSIAILAINEENRIF